MKKDYSNIVYDYMENNLSPQKRLEYENELLKNTELKGEHILQKQSIQGIKQSRYQILKTRLNNLPTPTILPQSTSIITTTAGKLIASVGGGAVLLASLYFGYSYLNESQTSEKINAQTEQEIADINILNPKNKQEGKNLSYDKTLTSPAETEITTSHTSEEAIQLKQSTSSTKKRKEAVLKDSMGQDIITDNVDSTPIDYQTLEHPSLPFSDVNKDMKVEEEKESIVSNKKFKDNISTTNNVSSKYKFHYQFLNGNLVLHGRFGTTYKVIELNEDGKNEFYLFYKKNYYKLETSKSIPTPLEKISKENVEIIKKKLVN